MSDDLASILKAGKVLVDAVSFDDCGALIGGRFMGGNGGLISRQTIEKADALRRIISDIEGRQNDAGA
jgi:hypothetical protein